MSSTLRILVPSRMVSTLHLNIGVPITNGVEGKTLNTQAIVRAIAAASASGGGNVVVPKGTFITGGKNRSCFPKSHWQLCLLKAF